MTDLPPFTGPWRLTVGGTEVASSGWPTPLEERGQYVIVDADLSADVKAALARIDWSTPPARVRDLRGLQRKEIQTIVRHAREGSFVPPQNRHERRAAAAAARGRRE